MVVDDGKGGTETVVFDKPGGEIRFTVGDDRRRSATWKIWAGRHNPTVYIAVRLLGSELKISLHDGPNGPDWRVQWEKKYMKAHPEIATRIIDTLQKPPEIGESGWAKGLSIWVRYQDVAAPAKESLPDDLLWLPTPPEGHATGVHIILGRPTNVYVKPGGQPIGGFMLADGRVVVLILSKSVINEETNRLVDGAIEKFRQGESIENDGISVYRALARTNATDGVAQLWDIAVMPDPARGSPPTPR